MKKIFTFILFLFASSAIAQEKIYLPLFEALNMHPDYEYSSSRLFKTYLEQDKKYQVIIPARPDSTFKYESFEESLAKAKEMNAKYFIKGELNRIGEVVVVSVNMYDQNGDRYWGQVKKARTPDDLDPILSRIAQNLSSGQTTDAEDIYSVTEYESQNLNVKRSNSYFGIMLGGVYTFLPDANKKLPAGFGLGYSLDIREMIVNINGELFFGDVDYYHFYLESAFPLSKKANTFFLSGGLGLGGVNIDREVYNGNYTEYSSNSEGGLMFLAGAGYMVNRTSDVRLAVTSKVILPTFRVANQYPAGLSFGLSVYF